MKFTEVLNRLTGISTPILGISWNPTQLEVTVARRIITKLEDRRVLYAPSEMEMPSHCVISIIEIRKMLTDELSELGPSSHLSSSLRAMRAACRKFLDSVGSKDDTIVKFGFNHGHYASWEFLGSLGELRGVFGIHLARISAQYKLDIEDDLASILPVRDEEIVLVINHPRKTIKDTKRKQESKKVISRKIVKKK